MSPKSETAARSSANTLGTLSSSNLEVLKYSFTILNHLAQYLTMSRSLEDIDLCAIQLQGAAATVPSSRGILVLYSKAELKSV